MTTPGAGTRPTRRLWSKPLLPGRPGLARDGSADAATCCDKPRRWSVCWPSAPPLTRRPRRATVIWTRHRRPPDLTPQIRAWFASAAWGDRLRRARDPRLDQRGRPPARPRPGGRTSRRPAVHLPRHITHPQRSEECASSKRQSRWKSYQLAAYRRLGTLSEIKPAIHGVTPSMAIFVYPGSGVGDSPSNSRGMERPAALSGAAHSSQSRMRARTHALSTRPHGNMVWGVR